MDRELVKAAFRAVATGFLPSNVRRWSMLSVDSEPPVNAMMGFRADYKPVEGRVVAHLNTDDATDAAAIAIKTGRTEFALVSVEILPSVPDVGDVVLITPYARRLFDGSRLDAPKIEECARPDGTTVRISTIRLGDDVTPLPIGEVHCEYLQHLVRQIERLKAPDGFRSIAQMLVDANATAFTVVDPSADCDILITRPAISFRVRTGRFSGRVTIDYWRVPDLYEIQFASESGQTISVEDVDFSSLGSVLEQHLDDGEWRLAKMEVKKKSVTRGKGSR